MSECEEIDMCGYLRLFKKDGTEGSIYQLSLNEVCSIGNNISATIRLKSDLSKLPQSLCIVSVDMGGVAMLLNKDINQPIKLNNKSLRGSRYLLPGDCFVVLGKKIRYNNPSLTAEQIQCLKSKNTKAMISPKLRHSTVATTRKSLIRSTKTNLDRCHSKRSHRNNNIDSPMIVSEDVTKIPDARKHLSFEVFGENVAENKQSTSKMRKSQVSILDKPSRSIGSLKHTNDYVTLAKSTKHRSLHDLNAMPNYESVSKGLISSPGQFEQDSSNVSMTSEPSETDRESEEALEESVCSNVNGSEVSPEPELQEKEEQSRKKRLLSFEYSDNEKCELESSNEQLSSPGSLSTNSNSSSLIAVNEDKTEDSGGIQIGLLTSTPISNIPNVKAITDVQKTRKPSIKRRLTSLRYTDLHNCSSSALGENTNDKKSHSADLESSNLKNASSDVSMTSEEKYTSTDEELNLPSRMNTSHILTPNLKGNILKGKHSQSLKKSCGRSSCQYTNDENVPQYSNTIDRKNQSSRFSSEDSDDTDHWNGNEQRSGPKINKSCTLTPSTKPNISRIKCQTEVITKRKRSIRRSLPKLAHSSHTLATNNLKSRNNIEDMESDSPETKFKLSSNLSNRLTSEDTDDLEESKHISLSRTNKSSTLTLGSERNLSESISDDTDDLDGNGRTSLPNMNLSGTLSAEANLPRSNSHTELIRKCKQNITRCLQIPQELSVDESSMPNNSQFASEDTDDSENKERSSQSNMNNTLIVSPKGNVSQIKSQTEVRKRRKQNSRRSLQNHQYEYEDSSFTFGKTYPANSSYNNNNMEREDMKNVSCNDHDDNQKVAKAPKSPKNELSDLRGVRKLMSTPKALRSPKNELSDLRGVRKLMLTTKASRSPKNELSDLRGVRKLMSTPKVSKSPRNELADLRGVRKLMSTPKVSRSPKNELSDLRGVRKLMSPKAPGSPKNELSDLRGVRKLMSTPKESRSPKNDLSDLRGVRKLMSPKASRSPKNELSDLRGVRKLMSTPKVSRSPKNELSDLRGVRNLMSPKASRSPKNELSDLCGVRKLMSTPKVHRSPYNDLSDFIGVKKLMSSPNKIINKKKENTKGRKKIAIEKNSKNYFSNSDKCDTLEPEKLTKDAEDYQPGKMDNVFDSLLVNKPLRTYRGKSTSPLKVKSEKSDETYIPCQTEQWVQEYKTSEPKNESPNNLCENTLKTEGVHETVKSLCENIKTRLRTKKNETTLRMDTQTTETNFPKTRGRIIKIKSTNNLDSDVSSNQINEVVTPQKHTRGKESKTTLEIDTQTTETNLPKRRGRPIKTKSIKNLDSDASSTKISEVITPEKDKSSRTRKTASSKNVPSQLNVLSTSERDDFKSSPTEVKESKIKYSTRNKHRNMVTPRVTRLRNKQIETTDIREEQDVDTVVSRLNGSTNLLTETHSVINEVEPSVSRNTRRKHNVAPSKALVVTSKESDTEIETKPKRKSRKEQKSELSSTTKEEVVECRRSKRTRK